MKSPVVKRSIVLAGHKTSVSLEDPFWESLKEIVLPTKSDNVFRWSLAFQAAPSSTAYPI